MRHFTTIWLLFLLLPACAQLKTQIKIINSITNKPLTDVHCRILKNEDTYFAIRTTDQQGIITIDLPINNIDTYQLYIREEGFKMFRQTIDLKKEDLITIRLSPESLHNPKRTGLTYSSCSLYYFGNYEPKIAESLDDIPDSIRISLLHHLNYRLGPDFYSKLSFTGGQIVNLNRLYIAEPKAINYKWIPRSYYLCFALKDTLKGIALYSAQIILDQNGNIVKEIELPNIHDDPQKSNIIPLNEAKLIALKNNFMPDSVEIGLTYDKSVDALCWSFTKKVSDNGLTFTTRTLLIDCHRGTITGTSDGSGIR